MSTGVRGVLQDTHPLAATGAGQGAGHTRLVLAPLACDLSARNAGLSAFGQLPCLQGVFHKCAHSGLK